MGLLSKLKVASGALKARAGSAIGALRASKVGAAAGRVISSPAGRVTSKLGTSALRIASPIAKISTAVTAATFAVKGVKAISRKVKESRAAKVTAGASAIAGGAALAANLKNQPGQKTGLVNRAISYAKANPIKTAIGAAAVAAVGYGIYKAVTRKKKKKKSTTRRKSRKTRRSSRRSTRRTSRSRTRRRRYGSESQYKRKGGLDVKYTKNGQPYVIQANGRARFVKRSRR